MIKTLQPSKDMFMQFTEEELEELNITPSDKFTAIHKDGGIFLEKWKSIELDLSEFSEEIKDVLIFKSIEKQIPVDEVINEFLKDYFNNLKEE